MKNVPRLQGWRGWLPLAALLMLSACGSPEAELEALAADCPERPELQLGDEVPHFVMINAYYLQEEAARELRSGARESAVVEEVFAKASALGVRAVRTNGFNDDPSRSTAIQRAPGVHDELSFRGLDLVLARARAYGLELVLPLGNYWNAYGGARQYVTWAGLPNPVEGDPRFFTDRRVIDFYKAHLKILLNRVNTVDGIRYGDHPAVLAWELLNEPRNTGLDPDGAALRAWVDEVGAQVKALAPSHLVSTGEEGLDVGTEGYDATFWGGTASSLFTGAGSFRRNLGSPSIDFASIHWYPENWGLTDDETAAEAGAHWIREHTELARQAGKPLLVGEFALRNGGRIPLPLRRAMYRGWLRCMRSAGVGGGGPWMFAYDARPDEWDEYTFYYRDGTRPSDPVNRYADLVVEAAKR